MSIKKICIDEGHNRGQDQGASAIGSENRMNIATGELVITKLKTLGYEVLRTLDYVPEGVSVSTSLADRVNIANSWGADLYVSIHANCGGGKGTEVWIGSDSSKDIATKICNNIANDFGYTNRGVKVQGVDGEHLYVLRYTNMPAMLVEQCFVDSQDDMNKWNAEKMASDIVKGITGEVTPTPTPKPVVPVTPKYDETIPQGVYQFTGTSGYIEQSTDGRLLLHKDRGNYIAIGKGFIDIYWNDNNGHGGSKRING